MFLEQKVANADLSQCGRIDCVVLEEVEQGTHGPAPELHQVVCEQTVHLGKRGVHT